MTGYILETKIDEKIEKKYEEIQTVLNYDAWNFQSDQPNVAIKNSIQTDDIFDILLISWLSCTKYSKN